MFRKTSISLTLAALTAVATMSAAPALAAPTDDGSISSAGVGGSLLDFTDVVADTMEDAPEATTDCFAETDESWVPCIDLGSLFGLPAIDEPGTEESLTPGGIMTDAPIDVVEAESDLIDPGLLPDISDIIDYPGATDADETEPSEGAGMVEIVEGSDLAGALSEAEIPTLGGAVDAESLPEADEPTPSAETVPTPAEETMVDAVTSDLDSGADATSPVAPGRNSESGTAETTITTVPVVDDSDGEQDVLAVVELSAPATSDSGIDPLQGALFGSLAALVLTGIGFAAFKLGRRGA